MAKVIVSLGGQILKEVIIQEDSTKVGRDATNHIHLNNPAVSRFHAEIYRQGWSYFVEDLKSTNGTYLNGNFVSWKIGLNDNDKISIGKFTLTFRLEPRDYPEKFNQNALNPFETVCIVPDKK